MRTNLFKSLLVAVMAIGAMGGVKAQDTYEEVYSRTTWSETDVTDWSGNASLSINADNGLGAEFTLNSSAYTAYAEKTFSINDNSKIKYEVSWVVGSGTGTNSNFTYIQFGDNIRLSWGYDYCTFLDTNGKSSTTTKVGTKGANHNIYTKKIEIIFNTASNTVEKITLDNTDLTDKMPTNIAGNMNKVQFGISKGDTKKWTWPLPNYIKSIKVSEAKQKVTTANYTINYKYDGNIISTTNSEGIVGTDVNASSIVNDESGNKYFTKEVNPKFTLQASNNNFEVEVRKPYSAKFSLETLVNNESVSKTNSNLEETDDRVTEWSYVYSKYINKDNKDNKYYVADDITKFGETGSFKDGDDILKTVSYSNEAKDVVFFKEAESVSGNNTQYSNGATGVVTAQNSRNRGIRVGVLKAGKYIFEGNITGNHKRSLVIREYIADPASNLSDEEKATVNAKILNAKIFATLSYKTQTVEFTLDKETELVINGANANAKNGQPANKTNQSEDFDYVVVKASLPATETVKVSEAGYATYATKYNVEVPKDENVKVMTVKVNAEGTAIELNEVAAGRVIPANTGILVKADQGNHDFVITSKEGTPLENNNLIAATEPVKSDGATFFALTKMDTKVGFAVVKEGVNIPAGKAYLKVIKSTGAKFFGLDGEATGINSVKTAKADGAYYTLEGVKTTKPVKGIYIHNGKKIVVK